MEIYLIIGIVIMQFAVFFKTYRKIIDYKSIFRNSQSYNLNTIEYFLDEEDVNSPIVEEFRIDVVLPSMTLKKILKSINEYLKSNKGATADMSLLKNIVERNITNQENEINALTPLPLYLGLIGTMLGIVFGLFNMPEVNSTGFAQGIGIDTLIGGVKYAMIASVIGVLFTSILSGWVFREGKNKVETNVNDFLTFLESKLLPILKEDVSANLHNLYQNLASFNHKFSVGVNQLEGIMDKTHSAVLSQVNLINELKRIDVSRMAEANVLVFSEMKELMPQFHLLNKYVEGINETFKLNTDLNVRITGILDRTSKVEDVANYIQKSTNQSIQLNEIVEKHFDELRDRNQQFVTSANGMENKAKLAIDHFKAYIEEQIESLKEVTRKEETLMIEAFKENRGVLSKLNELSEIKEELKAIKNRPVTSFKEEANRIISELKKIQNLPLASNSSKNKQRNKISENYNAHIKMLNWVNQKIRSIFK